MSDRRAAPAPDADKASTALVPARGGAIVPARGEAIVPARSEAIVPVRSEAIVPARGEALAPLIERGAQFYRSFLAPLVLGGTLAPVRPLGPALAARLAALGPSLGGGVEDLRAEVEAARARRARRLLPLDEVPPIGPDEWRLAAAFNDLLQVANPHLPGLLGPGRPQRLLDAVEELVAQIAPPSTVEACVARHVTFAAAFAVVRVDTEVKWWVGSASFRGERPPPRLLLWPALRRVRVDEARVPLESLVDYADLPRDAFLRA
ncbi:MAG TPA: hypothetical protein VFS00_29610, partial [Polyangiaceae bacterium]|nr:hypothetical protein [Polyangiaceae bacterium]